MKNLILIKLLVIVSITAFGWGQTGHRVTGKIADRYLNKKARAAIARLLNGQSLAMSSTWMDEIRSDSTFDYTADWHWVTVQDGETYDKSTKNPNGDIIEVPDPPCRRYPSTSSCGWW
jgi:hypothetical protein